MITFAGLFLIAAQAPVAGEDLTAADRIQVQSALARAQVAIGAIGSCHQVAPRDDETTYDGRLWRLLELMSSAEELYEIELIGESLVMEAEEDTPPCSAVSLRLNIAQADQALAEAASLIGIDAASRSEGLWFGPLRLCGERVISIETEGPVRPGENQRLVFRFSEAFVPQIETFTRARVGQSVFILLNGATISAFVIHEAVGGTGVSLEMRDDYSAQDFRRAVTSGC